MNPVSILSIIDFSDSSKEVLKWSACMAEKFNVNLTILHPYRLNQLDKKENMVGVKKKLEHDAAKNFEALIHEPFKNPNIAIDFRAEVGFIQDRVQDYARRNNILFLVIGFNLAAGNKEILEEIATDIEAPLVVVPNVTKKVI